MEKTFTRIWIHLLFSTKNQLPLILPRIEPLIHTHLQAQLTECGCAVKIINGTSDHVHCLFQYNPKLSLNDIVKQIKGNTSHWVNDHNLIPDKFVWQKGFSAFSVSDAGVAKVFDDIKANKLFHTSRTYLQEVDELITKHGFVQKLRAV